MVDGKLLFKAKKVDIGQNRWNKTYNIRLYESNNLPQSFLIELMCISGSQF